MSEILKTKLLAYEEQPPASAWENINNALDEEHTTSLSERLQNFKATPNPIVWDRISQQLDSGQENLTSKTYPFTQPRRNRFKYLSAAAVLILAATGIFLFVDNRKNTDVAGTSVTEIKADPNTDLTTSNSFDEEENIETEVEKTSALPSSKNNKKSVAKRNLNRYMYFTTEKGKTIKVSRKLYAVFDCADHATAINSRRCKEDIESLQRKIATAPVTPASDFSSVIDMIKTLEKEN